MKNRLGETSFSNAPLRNPVETLGFLSAITHNPKYSELAAKSRKKEIPRTMTDIVDKIVAEKTAQQATLIEEERRRADSERERADAAERLNHTAIVNLYRNGLSLEDLSAGFSMPVADVAALVGLN